MKTIWKFSLEIKDEQEVLIPKKSKFLSLIEQSGIPTIYYLVNPDNLKEHKRFIILGTGHVHTDNDLNGLVFLGTVNCPPFVWHVFEKEGK